MLSLIVLTDINDINSVKKANFFTQELDPYSIRKVENRFLSKPAKNTIINQRLTAPHVFDHNKLINDIRNGETNVELTLLSKDIKMPSRPITMIQNYPESLKTSFE